MKKLLHKSLKKIIFIFPCLENSEKYFMILLISHPSLHLLFTDQNESHLTIST